MEPSPFTHVSGMKNRFESLIRGLRDCGDEVSVITPCCNPPKHFHGAQVRTARCVSGVSGCGSGAERQERCLLLTACNACDLGPKA